MKFDPFEDRTCRDIRNELGHLFIRAIQKDKAALFTVQADHYLSQKPARHIAEYISHLKIRFDKIFRQFNTDAQTADTFWDICLALWNNKLFFECHEWLEEKWIKAEGNRKKAFQALILCAVAYEQLQYNRNRSAKKLGEKAIALLSEFKKEIPPCFDVAQMINALERLSPAPELGTN